MPTQKQLDDCGKKVKKLRKELSAAKPKPRKKRAPTRRQPPKVKFVPPVMLPSAPLIPIQPFPAFPQVSQFNQVRDKVTQTVTNVGTQTSKVIPMVQLHPKPSKGNQANVNIDNTSTMAVLRTPGRNNVAPMDAGITSPVAIRDLQRRIAEATTPRRPVSRGTGVTGIGSDIIRGMEEMLLVDPPAVSPVIPARSTPFSKEQVDVLRRAQREGRF